MTASIRCAHCSRLVPGNSRVKVQHYCGAAACQRARKTKWQRRKLAEDRDYRDDQRDCRRRWQAAHPDYWREYRRKNPSYVEGNRLKQKRRDAQESAGGLLAKMDALKPHKSGRIDTKPSMSVLAKMDASAPGSPLKLGFYYLGPHLANMDALFQKISSIPDG